MKLKNLYCAVCCTAILLPAAVLAEESAATAKTPDKTESQAKPDKTAKTQCAQTTGSRIKPAKSRDCSPSTSAVRTYSGEQLRETGKLDTVEALRQLDPAVH